MRCALRRPPALPGGGGKGGAGIVDGHVGSSRPQFAHLVASKAFLKSQYRQTRHWIVSVTFRPHLPQWEQNAPHPMALLLVPRVLSKRVGRRALACPTAP